MSRNPGAAGGPAAQAVPALRLRRPGWRDPRLWVGVLLVAVSVVAGARLLASADESVAVWAVDDAAGAGAVLGEADLVARRVRFVEDTDLTLYFPADQPLPEGSVLTRSVGAGELLARSAVAIDPSGGLVQVPLEVEAGRVPGAVAAGSVVDVYVDDRAQSRGSDGIKLLGAVTVVDAPAFDAAFAVSGYRQVVVAVPPAFAENFESMLARMDDPVLRIHYVR
ncbi:hypothetical protein [Nocardioides sp. YIM 152588]|uniref:hypothetical protein n=1 Tax=Nocardioides sp. YIM 152588 TaxID=3158259 RepID=UPI0032E49D7E